METTKELQTGDDTGRPGDLAYAVSRLYARVAATRIGAAAPVDPLLAKAVLLHCAATASADGVFPTPQAAEDLALVLEADADGIAAALDDLVDRDVLRILGPIHHEGALQHCMQINLDTLAPASG